MQCTTQSGKEESKAAITLCWDDTSMRGTKRENPETDIWFPVSLNDKNRPKQNTFLFSKIKKGDVICNCNS